MTLGPSAFKQNGVINFKSYNSLQKRDSNKLSSIGEEQPDIQTLRLTQYAGFLKTQKQKEELERQREEISSRDTMFRFYSKDTDKIKRTTTPGYIGIEPV